MLAAPLVRTNSHRHHRAGTNLASHALAILAADPQVRARARAGPFPRLQQLLDVLPDVPAEIDAAGDYWFDWPGPDGSRRLRLDELPL